MPQSIFLALLSLEKSYTLLIILTALLAKTIIGQITESPCPNIFHYQYDQAFGWYGEIHISNPDSQVVQLNLELSVGNVVEGGNGNIELASSSKQVIDDVKNGRPIRYRVIFPAWSNIPPKVAKIVVNGQLICSGPKLTVSQVPVVTTINLQHTLRIGVQPLAFNGGTSVQNVPNLDYNTQSRPFSQWNGGGGGQQSRPDFQVFASNSNNNFNLNQIPQNDVSNGNTNPFFIRPVSTDISTSVSKNPFFTSSMGVASKPSIQMFGKNRFNSKSQSSNDPSHITNQSIARPLAITIPIDHSAEALLTRNAFKNRKNRFNFNPIVPEDTSGILNFYIFQPQTEKEISTISYSTISTTLAPTRAPLRITKNRFNFNPIVPADPSDILNPFIFVPENVPKIDSANPFSLASTISPPLYHNNLEDIYTNRITPRPETSRPRPNLGPVSRPDLGSNINTAALSPSKFDDVCGLSLHTNNLVVYGDSVAKGAYPWLAALFTVTQLGLNYTCSGSLISEQHVVTAAHCVFDGVRTLKPRKLIIMLGRLNLQKWTTSREERNIEAEAIHVHPDYHTLNSDADIAMIVLSETVTFSNHIRPLCLWRGSNNLDSVVGMEGTVVGWGRDEEGNPMTSEAKQTKLPIVSQEQCLRSSQQFLYITSNRTFCAGFRDGSGPCNGDSGSGFIVKINERWTLRGIVSMSLATQTRACDLKNYVVFTDASKFITWMTNFFE